MYDMKITLGMDFFNGTYTSKGGTPNHYNDASSNTPITHNEPNNYSNWPNDNQSTINLDTQSPPYYYDVINNDPKRQKIDTLGQNSLVQLTDLNLPPNNIQTLPVSSSVEGEGLFMEPTESVYYPNSITQDNPALVPTSLNQLYTNESLSQSNLLTPRNDDTDLRNLLPSSHIQQSTLDSNRPMMMENEALALPMQLQETDHLSIGLPQDNHMLMAPEQSTHMMMNPNLISNMPLLEQNFSVLNQPIPTMNDIVQQSSTSEETESISSKINIVPVTVDLPIQSRKLKRRHSITIMTNKDYNDLKYESDEESCEATTSPTQEMKPGESYFTLLVGPGKHQVKEFNILPVNIIKLNYKSKSSDYMVVKLICDKKMKKSESEIFITAVSAYHSQEDPSNIYFPNLKISQQMLRGRTKGFNFRLKFILVIDGVEVEKVESEEFYLWSNVNQKGFPREERDSYVSMKVKTNKKRRRRG